MAQTMSVSNIETTAAQAGPAVLSNKFVVVVGPTVRVSFLEQYGADDPPQFRTAVALAHQDAIALANLLKDLLKDIEAQISEVQKAAEQDQNG